MALAPITVAHLGDLHFGFSQLARRAELGDYSQNQREADVERAAFLTADYIINELSPSLVVVPGDMMDATRISTSGLWGATRFARRFKEAGIPLVIIGGNHDHVESQVLPMLELLKEEGALIYLRQDQLDIGGLRLHLLPFRALARAPKDGTGLPELEFDFSEELPNVLVAHASVEGYGFGNDPVEVPATVVEDSRFAAVLLGHIHDAQQLKDLNAFYSGALERLNFGERQMQPGFFLHTFEDGALATSDFVTVASIAEENGVPYTPRPMLQKIVDAEGKTLEEVDKEVRRAITGPDIDGAIVKLLVHNVGSAFSRSQMRSEWQKAFYAAHGMSIEIVAQTRQVGELMDVEFASAPVHLGQAFAAFLDEQEFADKAEREELISLGQEILEQARDELIRREE